MRNFDLKLRSRPLEAVADHDLLITIAGKMNNPIQAGDAFNEFYFRYKNYVWNVCIVICGIEREAKELAKDIFQSTFLKVEMRAETYKAHVGIKAWLGRIAQNEKTNYFRRKVKTIIIDRDYEDLTHIAFDSSGDVPSFNRSEIEDALSKLADRERDVLMTYFRHYDHVNPGNHLPDYEIKYLRKKYSVSSQYLRKIKERALNDLKKLLKNNE